MAVLSAQTIQEMQLINPLRVRYVEYGMTGGLGPCGVDVTLSQDFIMWPFRFVLASAEEHFSLPRNVCARVHDKSSWARLGICVQTTFIEPGWEGFLTLEITNHSWKFRRLRKGMPIAQIVFEQLDKPTIMPYNGKYQRQEYGPQPARLEADRGFGAPLY